MKKQLTLLALLFLSLSCGEKKEKETAETIAAYTPDRYVENNCLYSKVLPEIDIQVAEEFKYIGTFDFVLKANSDEAPPELKGKAIAGGDRYVFAVADDNQKVRKLFIVQLEGFLPGIDYTYNYNFDTAEQIGNNKYRHNTWFYDSAQLAIDNPENEGALTRAFLEKKGYTLEDHFMMSRWVGLASEDRKNEIIMYYLEMLKDRTGHTLEEYEALDEDRVKAIKDGLIGRSKKSFSIVKG
ncbi:MAG: hypothetical protein AB3N14_05415 [Flavobacteriaceae bacterium]